MWAYLAWQPLVILEQDDEELVRWKPNLVKGEIAKAVVDVIVNSTSNKLELQNGAVSGSINKAAGPNLQAECKEKYPNGINVGDIAVTGPGNLRCQKVYHTCLSSYNKGSDGKNLENLILKCLRKAEAGGCKSIAFPAIGTGNLGFPRDLVARVFYQTINDYKSQGGKLSVNNIQIIVYPGDAATVKEFTDEDNNTGSKTKHLKTKPKLKATSDPRGAERQPEDNSFYIVTEKDIGRGIKVGKFKLTVTNGDLLDVNVPIIVNSSNSDLNLKIGAVSQAILKAGKERILQECDKARDVMKEKGIAITPVSGMNCKYVIHVDADRFNYNWKKAITNCLREADQKHVTSIAFPALGTGNYSTKTSDIAEALVKALNNTTNLTCLQNVHVVIYQESMFNPFVSAIQGAIQKNGKGLWNKITSYVSTSLGFGSNVDDEDGFDMDSETNHDFSPKKESEIREKILYFYSDDAEQIGQAMMSLDQTHREDFHKQRIDYNVKLSVNNLRKILKNESGGVKISVDETLKRIIIEGLTRDVADVANKVNEIILNAVEEERDVKHADILKDVIQWSRLETKGARPYPAHINKKIEDSFNLNKKTFSFVYNQNKNVINFDDMEVSEEGEQQNRKVIRQDKMKEAKLGIPKHWQIDDKSNLNVVTLAPSDSEYLIVQKNFAASGQIVKKIERIENRSLYEQYVSKKRQMELELQRPTVEKDILWHGTDENSIFSINNYGFNRSYCGKNATVHGQGVYFAVNSSYSVNYARQNSKGERKMYQCKVLVGDYTPGNSAYRVPPNKPGTTQVYNSLVDNTSNPSMYIIFNDTQAYPEYLITF
ncbi:protein mono-ADP-ribosyltransferase PARP15 isoform X2 [Patella vulgata]|uniref:protein mono-ADP-ribosyltransferase PARP15 isoform X2 n=1 Tax=Patella vulgata TaxID=6465 RepID=UPI0021804703|nr:protein mono-ADP-ribosyltransferase PARP15 isoform X2 [Patella vulgata]